MAGDGIQDKAIKAPAKGDDLAKASASDNTAAEHKSGDNGSAKLFDSSYTDNKGGHSSLIDLTAASGTKDTAGEHLEPVEIVDHKQATQEDKLDIATILKTDYMGGDSKRYQWLDQNATEKQIEEGINKRISEKDPDWHKKEATVSQLSDHQFKNGDIVTFQKDGEVQLAVVRIANGEIGFHRHVNKDGDGEPIVRFKDINQAFDGLEANSNIKIYSGSKMDGAPVVADKPMEAALEAQEASAPKPSNSSLQGLIAEREQLLAKKPEDVVEVRQGDKTVSMPVAERLKEVEATMLAGNDKSEAPIRRLEIIDPVIEGIKDASDKLRVHDLVIKTSVDEINKLQEGGAKPTDKIPVVKIVDGVPVSQEVTVEERVKELKTNIAAELNRSFETAEKFSPGPMDAAATRALDIKMAESVAARTRLAGSLGIIDSRELTIENLDKRVPASAQERVDLEALKDAVRTTDRIQDVRHGLAYTKLRSAEMKALGYANPAVPMGQTGTPADSISAMTDLTHARQVDAGLRASQAAYSTEIIVSSKVAPLLVNTERSIKFLDAERQAKASGMTIEETIDKAITQENKAKEIEALMTLGDKEASNQDKTEAIDILMELNRASKAGSELDIKTEEDALRLAAEKAKDLDLGFLLSESNRDYYKMRGIDGSIIDPDDPGRTVPSFSERFQAMVNVGARAKLEYSVMMRTRGQNSYTSLVDLNNKYEGKDLSQALEASKGTDDNKLLTDIAKRYIGDDPSKYQGVKLDTLIDKSKEEFDDATVLFMQVKAEAPHLIYKQDGGKLDYQSDDLRKLDYSASTGISSVDPGEWVKAKQRFDIIAQGKTDLDENGQKIDPRAELAKMYQVTKLIELDVKRQNEKLAERVEELKGEKGGLDGKQFSSEEARNIERQRLDQEIKLLEQTMKQREDSVKHQTNLTRFMDATYTFGQENFDEAKALLAKIKTDDPDLFNNKDLGMEEMYNQSSSWWARNWRTVAAGVTIVAAVGIGVLTAGAGSGVSAAMIAGAVGGGLFGGATYMGLEKYATGDVDATNIVDRFNSGKTSWRTGAEGFAMGFNVGGVTGLGKALFIQNSLKASAGVATSRLLSWQGAKTVGTYAAGGFAAQTPYMALDGYDVSQGNLDWKSMGLQTAGRTAMNGFAIPFLGAPASSARFNLNAIRFSEGASVLGNTARGVAALEAYAVTLDGFTKGIDLAGDSQFAPEWANRIAGRLGHGPTDPRYSFLQGNSGIYRDNTYMGFGAIRNTIGRGYSNYNGANLDVHNLKDYSRYVNNLNDSGAILGLRNATIGSMLDRGQNLPFQVRPIAPTVRTVYAPEISDKPLAVIQYGDGTSSMVPLNLEVYDSSKAEPSKLQFRVDGLVKDRPDPYGLRNK